MGVAAALPELSEWTLHCNGKMKVTNKKKSIFSLYSHNVNKKFQ